MIITVDKYLELLKENRDDKFKMKEWQNYEMVEADLKWENIATATRMISTQEKWDGPYPGGFFRVDFSAMTTAFKGLYDKKRKKGDKWPDFFRIIVTSLDDCYMSLDTTEMETILQTWTDFHTLFEDDDFTSEIGKDLFGLEFNN